MGLQVCDERVKQNRPYEVNRRLTHSQQYYSACQKYFRPDLSDLAP